MKQLDAQDKTRIQAGNISDLANGRAAALANNTIVVFTINKQHKVRVSLADDGAAIEVSSPTGTLVLHPRVANSILIEAKRT